MARGPSIRIRTAQSGDREALEDLQRRSSMHGPMFRDELVAHPDAIHLPAEQISEGFVRVAERDGTLVGFAVLLKSSMGHCELDGLFVDPGQMRAGIGRRLVDDAKRTARAQHATAIDVVANPQALAFYTRVGFVAAGEARTRFGVAPRMTLCL